MLSSIDEYRKHPEDQTWDLPPWGHPLSKGILPLCMSFEDMLFPIGTAFTIGRGIGFVVTAMHNIREAWKREPRLAHLLQARDLPRSVDMREVGFSVFHHRVNASGEISFTILPLQTVDGAPPTDVAFAFPVFHQGLETLVHPLGFDLPTVATRVVSIGYADFRFPDNGISLVDVRAGTFDWLNDYSHRFTVVEGQVHRIFTQRFSSAFVEGPCFTFDASIPHGLSGGPVITSDGIVIGVNAAGADSFFPRPMSIASLLYPLLLTTLRFGVSLGPIKLNGSRDLFSLIHEGAVASDGSELHVAFSQDPSSGSSMVNPRAPKAMSEFVHDDFASFQEGREATKQTSPTHRIIP